MTNTPEGVTPGSTTDQVLQELAKEGHTIGDSKPEFDENDGTLNEKEVEKPADKEVEAYEDKDPTPAKPADDKKPDAKEEDKEPEVKKPRTPSFVPSWKHAIAEDRREKAEKALADAQAKIAELSTKKPETVEEKEDAIDKVEDLAKKYDVDPGLVKDLTDHIKQGIKLPTELTDRLKDLDALKQERELAHAENEYTKEFDKDVLPILKAENPDLTNDAILEIKGQLKQFAFTDDYANLSLVKVFRAERDTITVPKPTPHRKSAENGKSGSTRTAEEIDFDKVDEAALAKMSDAEFSKYQAYQMKENGGSWKR